MSIEKDLLQAVTNFIKKLVSEEVAKALASLSHQQKPTPQTTPNKLMTPVEVSTQLRVRRETVYEALHSGDLPASKRPGRGGKMVWLIKPEDAQAWDSTLPARRKK